MNRHRVYVGIGANLGDPKRQVEDAIGALSVAGTVVRRSSLYRTRPWGKIDQPDFVNAVVLLETALEPQSLLHELKALERRLGRASAERWAARAIDLDILTYDDVRVDLPGLRVPHEHLRERAFVLVPLAEIDEGYTAACARLAPEERAGVAKLASDDALGSTRGAAEA